LECQAHIQEGTHATDCHQPGPDPEEESDHMPKAKKTSKKGKKGKR